MHTASPFLYKAAGSAKDFLVPAIDGTTEVLTGVSMLVYWMFLPLLTVPHSRFNALLPPV